MNPNIVFPDNAIKVIDIAISALLEFETLSVKHEMLSEISSIANVGKYKVVFTAINGSPTSMKNTPKM